MVDKVEQAKQMEVGGGGGDGGSHLNSRYVRFRARGRGNCLL